MASPRLEEIRASKDTPGGLRLPIFSDCLRRSPSRRCHPRPRSSAKIIWHRREAAHTTSISVHLTWLKARQQIHTPQSPVPPSIFHTQCWLLGPGVLGMQGRADKEFEFLAGLSVKVIKPLLMHPFVVAVSSSVTFIKYVQLNVTGRGSSLSCS